MALCAGPESACPVLTPYIAYPAKDIGIHQHADRIGTGELRGSDLKQNLRRSADQRAKEHQKNRMFQHDFEG